MSEITKSKSVASFLNMPSTSGFLDANLKDKRGEFVSNLIALSESDKSLKECDPKSLMMCALNATSLNLPLNKNLGFAYVIAYKGVPSFQIGYKGILQLAIRTGAYQYINAVEIREGEMIRNKFTGELTFNEVDQNNEVIGYLAVLKLLSGFEASVYMSNEQIEAHAMRFSQAYGYDKRFNKKASKWSDKDARPTMCKKTVLKKLLGTYGLLTTDMSKAIVSDNDTEIIKSETIVDAEIIPQTEPTEPTEPKTEPTNEKQTVKI